MLGYAQEIFADANGTGSAFRRSMLSPNRRRVTTRGCGATSTNARSWPRRLVGSLTAGGMSCLEHWSIRTPCTPPVRAATADHGGQR